MWLQKPPLGVGLDFSNPLNDDVVMHLAMNEGHGDKVYDLSKYGNHGTLNSFAFPPTATSGWNPGYKGIGIQFDDVDDSIDCGTNPIMDVAGKCVSIGARVKITGDSPSVVHRIFRINEQITIGIENTNKLGGWIYDDGWRGDWAESAFTLVHHKWYGFWFVWDELSRNYFVNGNSVKKISDPGSIDGVFSTVKIGTDETHPPNIIIDEIVVLNRAYTAKEVMERTIDPYGVYLQ